MANNKGNNKEKPNYNLHEFMNKHQKKVLAFISLTIVASMILSIVAQFMMFF